MASTLAAGARAAFGSIAPAQCGLQRHEELRSGTVSRGRSRACVLPPRSIGKKDRRLANNWAGSELRAVGGYVAREGTDRRAAGIRCSAENGAPKTKKAPIKMILSGPPASGKGTQAEELTKKYKVVHIAAGDLLRAEVAAGTENGKQAKALMDGGNLVPDEIVVTLVKERLAQPDVQEHGWLLDGYPRSESQAAALEKEGIHPDAFVILRVPDSSIVDRITGRRLDPETGKIYHMKYKKPESDEIAKRLVTRSDDTVEKVKTRLEVYSKHLNDVASLYLDEIVFVDGNRPPQEVFQDIDEVVQKLQRGEKVEQLVQV